MKRKRRILAMLLAASMCVLPMQFPAVLAEEEVYSEGSEDFAMYDHSPMEVGETRAVKLAIPETCTVEVTDISPNIIYTYNGNSHLCWQYCRLLILASTTATATSREEEK